MQAQHGQDSLPDSVGEPSLWSGFRGLHGWKPEGSGHLKPTFLVFERSAFYSEKEAGFLGAFFGGLVFFSLK